MSQHSQSVARIEKWVNRTMGRPLAWALYGLGLGARLACTAVRRGLARLSRPGTAVPPQS